MPSLSSGQGAVRYPWKEWLIDARPPGIILEKGIHFNCKPHSFAQQMRNAAYRLRYKVSISVHNDRIEVEAKKDAPAR